MILLTPGPTPVPARAVEAMSQPIIPHRSAEFEAILGRCNEMLRKVFRIDGPVLTLAGSGTTAFEAAQLSLVRPGDRTLTCASGKFGRRWQEIYDRVPSPLRISNTKITADWGDPIAPKRLEESLRKQRFVSVVTLVHSETSTATVNDVRALAAVVREHAPDAILIVDGITSVAAMPLAPDAWGIDVIVSGSQKALMLPPGLGFVALGRRALERLESIRHGETIAPLSLDLHGAVKAHAKNSTPFTPAIQLVRGLEVVLEMILEEGLESVWDRTARHAQACRDALGAMGLRLASSAPSDAVTGAWYPEGADDSVRAACRDKHGVLLAGGQEDWKGKVVRISHMGAVTEADLTAAIEALAAEFAGLPGVDPEAGVATLKERLTAASA